MVEFDFEFEVVDVKPREVAGKYGKAWNEECLDVLLTRAYELWLEKGGATNKQVKVPIADIAKCYNGIRDFVATAEEAMSAPQEKYKKYYTLIVVPIQSKLKKVAKRLGLPLKTVGIENGDFSVINIRFNKE